MNTINAMSLADIELDLPLRAVTDDLAGFSNQLSLKAGLEQGYAAFAAKTFSLGEISARAIGFADEVTRFVGLADTSEPQQVAYLFDVLIALSLLDAAATVTVSLAPPRTQSDFAARRRVLDDVVAAVGGDHTFAALARKAFAYPGMADTAPDDLSFDAATVSGLDKVRDGQPAMIGLEQGLSLMTFLRNLAPAGTLIERASLQLDDADRFAIASEADELDRERLDRLQGACHGARLLAAADLARASLIAAAATKDDQTVRDRINAIADRFQDERLRDVVRFAQAAAERLKELRIMQRRIADRERQR
ncbi:MAG: hypothetical protein Q8R85_07020 [Bosea sp. (in: a-proteobacteria)]|uniref:hypothetical protein n=1 Tax=Bosea sp. (in: a-proteobacteria) TaxID=1871050 RepID=UPI0027322C98|nr:hypothetical protein [Bosea sp. (in: a-proteobacteria)]MDP3600898.1 hypothetical protein [Bosea sp. (in: a-proteobacteria)]